MNILIACSRDQLDTPVVGDDENAPALTFALACLARCADLLEGLLTLYESGQWSVARILGRTLIEFWLYGQYFFLDGDAAIEQILGEDLRHQGTLELGRTRVWERLESQRDGGIDTRTGFVQPDSSRRQQLDVLAQKSDDCARTMGSQVESRK